MAKYGKVVGNRISVVSDFPFTGAIELSEDLSDLTNEQIIDECRVFYGGEASRIDKNKPAKTMRLAVITNWKMNCGIATYSENLCKELFPLVGDYKLFVEENGLKDNDKIVSCWKRGESLLKLANEVKKYNPDIVLIQHEFGIFPDAGKWLMLMNQLSEFRVIVMMHSVFHHLDKLVSEAAMPEIIVHVDGAKDVLLNEKEVLAKVHVIPHGCPSPRGEEKLWNPYKTKNTFLQAGFGFRYKNFERSIEAVKILKDKYPDVFFTGIFSESQFTKKDHDYYYNELMVMVEKLGVQENVGIIRGYQSDKVMSSFYRTNKVAVLPYITHKDHEVFGSSGSCVSIMSHELPTITSSIPHFSGPPSIKTEDAEELARELDKLFSSQEAIDKQIELQNEYLEDNTWEKTAQKYIDVFNTAK